ncbi:MAG: superoxide dismutase [Proteobacteria bacterium]|nr:superoxide dismutase [Pseudomonadota bacterium]
MSASTRREFLGAAGATLLVGSGAATSTAAADAAASLDPRAYGYSHAPVPLPFAARALRGISEKLIQSHWENNYGGAVKALNVVRSRLAQAASDANTPPYLYTGLKREQLLRTGSVVLHEAYFGNLGGDGKAPAKLRSSIADSFGSFDAWEAEFRKIGLGLGGGSGWVVLGWNRRLGLLENSWMADHGTGPIDTIPLLVLDMYEHAYQMDYGAAAAKYIDAFFANVHWDVVGARLALASQVSRT